ncbi:MAG: DUF4294 domain-containing protein [Prevotellaceae bacterium]|jgi:hypothetical protein|nr:DUF4294 domain-containing protein [Prevotellaceae bacterium]
MKDQIKYIVSLLLLITLGNGVAAQSDSVAKSKLFAIRAVDTQPVNHTEGAVLCSAVIIDGDTFPYITLPMLYCYPPLKFKNKKQEDFYWRTVRDVKKVLPLSKYIRGVIEKTNSALMSLPDKTSRNTYMKRFEKRIYTENEKEFKELTLNQGKLLIRLVDRETNTTSYELIKEYRGSFRAGFWQVFAKLFGADLKSKYGNKEEDQTIERIITLVEAGQL